MPLIVQKYGGSSLATPEHFKNVAQHAVKTHKEGNQVVVVVSAMGNTTNELIKLAKEVTPNPPRREMDMLLSVGERKSIALLAMAIDALGCEAISFTGSQVGIITDNHHTQARILEVKGLRIPEALKEGKIVIVAGFQGVSINKEITTLGRGGTDATAVALAASLGADKCQIMKDVDGVFTADPKLIPNVKLNPELSYDEMLQMSELGAGVINQYAVEIAKHYHVKIAVGNSFTKKIGTIITDKSLDTAKISGIILNDKVLALKFNKNDDKNLWSAQKTLEKRRWKIYYSYLSETSFWVVMDNEIEHEIEEALNTDEWNPAPELYEDIALVSVVGSGLNYNAPLVKNILHILEEWNGEILSLQASMQKISIIINKKNNLKKLIESLYAQVEQEGN